MRFNIQDTMQESVHETVVGNVYPVRGGSGARKGNMHVIIAIKDMTVVTVTVDKDGDVCGGSAYGLHYFQAKTPIAFCDGIDALNFEMRGLG